MKKLSPSEIEAEITQAHANIIAMPRHELYDRTIVRELRAVYTLGRDQEAAAAIERADFGKLNFPGGPVSIPKPQPSELVLNVKQWLTAAREAAAESRSPGAASKTTRRAFTYIESCLKNAEASLMEVYLATRDTLPPSEPVQS